MGLGEEEIAELARMIDASILFSELLAEAERRFGPRSRTLTPVVDARDQLIPETIPNGADSCIVHYAREAQHDHLRLSFQLAHEAIHVLSGALSRDALKLEEGFATWFSLHNSQGNRKYRGRARALLPPIFKEALALFCQIRPTDDRIKYLRNKCSDLDRVTPDLLTEVFLVSNDLARQLCERVSNETRDRFA
jgi:hypothetical protein